MKTIKFRIFDPVKKQMRESGATPMMLSSFFENSATLDTVHKMKYQQFTGLLDKNGVEIYEGDILSLSRCNPKEYKVGFIEGAFCLCFIKGIWKNHYALDMNYIQQSLKKKSEVIGNIYQNPELVDNSH